MKRMFWQWIAKNLKNYTNVLQGPPGPTGPMGLRGFDGVCKCTCNKECK